MSIMSGECFNNCFSNLRGCILRCCLSCVCQTDHASQDSSFYGPMRHRQVSMNHVGYRRPVRHRYAPCSPRYSGPETLEVLFKAIESLEKMNERNVNPADGDGNNVQVPKL